MEIRTERLTLRPIGLSDFVTTHEYASDPENTRFMLYLPNDSEEETRGFLRASEEEWKKPLPADYELAVVFDGTHIGCISLTPDEPRTSAEFGWIINKRFQRRGFAYEAASALLKYAADNLGIKHFIAHCDSENAGSRGVMEKLGMTLTKEYGGRRNKLSDEERRECLYEITV